MDKGNDGEEYTRAPLYREGTPEAESGPIKTRVEVRS